MLFSTTYASAQIVNIPDTAFKRLLLAYRWDWGLYNQRIDTNDDGEISQQEASLVPFLPFTALGDSSEMHNINDLTGLEAFTNLDLLNIQYTNAISINLTSMPNIRQVAIANNYNIQSIDLSNNHRLEVLVLRYLASSTVLQLGTMDSLGTLQLSNVNFESFAFRNFPRLSNVSLMETGIKYADFSNMHLLTDVTIYRSPTNNVSITRLDQLNVANCNNLKSITVYAEKLSQLDISSCFNLTSLYVSSDSLRELNVKNGNGFDRFECYNSNVNNVGMNICADEFEVDEIRNFYNGFGNHGSINVSSYCTLLPGGNYNTIIGRASVDLNTNGCDTSDFGMPQLPLKITDTTGNRLYRYTSSRGYYAHYPYKGVFTVAPYFPYAYFTITPTTPVITFDTANSLRSETNFCITPNGVFNDLEISFLPDYLSPRPGFPVNYILVYKNRGTTTLSGDVQVSFDNSKMNFTQASENANTQINGQLSWNYNNLRPFQSKEIRIAFSLLPPPINNIGDTIVFLATINPSANDETAFDNNFTLMQTVRGSFDPNEKQCLEGGKLDISKIGDYLHYQIHFQNEGTDTAFNIVVADTLSDKLDWNSFEFIGSSHACNPQLKNNKAEFVFENIHLPYKAIDEPGSNGWVAFKIKPKPSVVIGDSLNNSAAIYFDFNLPVITNTATTIVSSSSSPVPVKLEYFSVNKKDNTNMLNWKASCTYGNASFVIERSNDGIHPIAIGFSSIGNISATSLRCQLPFNFNDNNPVAGKNYYRLKITDADGKSFYSKTLVVGNNKAGLEITAVANNIIYLNSNKQQTVQMKVIAADGREMLNEKQTLAAGSNNISLLMKNVARGIYSLVIYTEEGMVTKKFVQ